MTGVEWESNGSSSASGLHDLPHLPSQVYSITLLPGGPCETGSPSSLRGGQGDSHWGREGSGRFETEAKMEVDHSRFLSRKHFAPNHAIHLGRAHALQFPR